MTVVVVVVMTVCVMLVIVPCVIMAMIMMGVRCVVPTIVTIAGIGPAFRIERRFDLDNARTKSLHHSLDHMIMTNPKTLSDNLGRQMPIAEVPSQPHQMRWISSSDFKKLLGGSDHLDQPAILQHQRIAAAQGNCLLQIKKEFKAASTRHRHTAAMTVVETKHHSVSRRLVPAIMWSHLRCADHINSLTTFWISPRCSMADAATSIIGHPPSQA